MSESGGLLESLKRLATTLIAIMQTRFELLSNEVEEELLRIGQMLLYSSIALFFGGLSILLLTVVVVLCFWDSHPLLILSSFSVLYIAISLWALSTLRRAVNKRSKLFSATSTEFSVDIEKIGKRP